MLAALGQFCKELVEGWIPSTTTWSRAYAWFARIVLGQQEGCSLPNCISGRSPDFFSTLCALLPQFCLWQFCDHNVRPEPILPSSFLALYHSESCIFPLHSQKSFCYNLLSSHPRFSTPRRNCSPASCHPAFCNWKLVHSAPLSTSTISARYAIQRIASHCSKYSRMQSSILPALHQCFSALWHLVHSILHPSILHSGFDVFRHPDLPRQPPHDMLTGMSHGLVHPIAKYTSVFLLALH